ncbi:Cytosolic iron-sulfur assembly component 2B [Coemansia sp. RSA 2399]|nr:Cytosolic iron-sulfur assembly component 2B [Coemansia sp. RSA 2399]KAJ1903742.1 Cytosolic iron-sulfur assembly component 2B [Coemansia sp. IMI 209127]
MNITQKVNDAPLVYEVVSKTRGVQEADFDDSIDDPIDSEEVYGLIRSINDPEHPLTLEQLHVANREHIYVDDQINHVLIEFTPTIPHCSMATLIGLCIRVRLLRSLPERFKIDIKVRQGTHQSEDQVNKQLNDKERVAAALENTYLLDVVNQCLATAA